MHPLLTKIKNQFGILYYFESPNKNILKVSDSSQNLPFAIIVIEKSRPVVSFTFDFVDALKIADFTVGLMHISPIDLAESFWITKTGDVLWGEEAMARMEIDLTIDINHPDLIPPNSLLN